MKIIVQRVSEAGVDVVDEISGKPDTSFEEQRIGHGLLLLVGVADSDGDAQVEYAARKIANMRIFGDEVGKMNKSVLDVGGQVLSVSQFTLFADIKKGNRPSFVDSGEPGNAKAIWEQLNRALEGHGLAVKTGRFGAHMRVRLLNDGPVTIPIDTDLLMAGK
ncbi:D-tyrosyl-tRNA(Tyr) deacylase [Bifidobacterium actinocoloniiforme DSM 22766]|uniref:D-aminoacyl-tRNA deacylase n=1 Tax=Bifidobacterium actinocoloniiforme DSM 22766 TaxID=1437605 RepID=A0A086YZS5_9BIFI|nr:D-aminoacyl-tRNA deacylase [Bifidobacterium actinocoloniiforme]AKV55069.1 D-tyrosyl-tRNA(Tyr) deacylase [Bifidobacterium actinocoloniiforme DSM 22766]KFI39775.1 D-tyrosyl-tRNA(Tyr) deacylase [Bifidobacterium actinocoloniiforme DSM 22766]